jgi:hypothetical protein
LAVLAELSARNMASQRGYRGLAHLLGEQLRCTLAEAHTPAVAVERFGARRGLTGEALEPMYPATAEAFAAGGINPEHAAVIAETVEAIPAADRTEHAERVETTLLEQARLHDPHAVRQLGKRIPAHLDPDGPSPEEQSLQQAHRRVNLTAPEDAAEVPEVSHPSPTGHLGNRAGARTTPSRRPAGGCSRLGICPTTPGCPANWSSPCH